MGHFFIVKNFPIFLAFQGRVYTVISEIFRNPFQITFNPLPISSFKLQVSIQLMEIFLLFLFFAKCH